MYSMYYDEEVTALEAATYQSISIANQSGKETVSIIVINGDSPALQNKIALELQNLLPKNFMHINIYQKLMQYNTDAQLNTNDLSETLETIHQEIVSLAENGNNLIISHNSIFASEQSNLYNSLKGFAPYWVDLEDKKKAHTYLNLHLNINSLSVTQATFMIYNSLVTHLQKTA
ncbi:hypothetical protein HOM50_01595 [bacterium]|jgi:hypothetical protein|nr:hypothetical protein [bacterium]MBT5015083.1 hypothetical protein [bacterium]